MSLNDTPKLIAAVKSSRRLIAILCSGIALLRMARAENPTDQAGPQVLTKENQVDSAHVKTEWHPVVVGQKLAWGDRLRTGEDSRATIRLSDASLFRVDEFFEGEILPPTAANDKASLD